ncbi:hypothetical protein [Rhizobium laguerreae]|uniref:hypothetical protein n=1 Tax=Rhizobium laguerreae TaxID=1076926 RepID=UPI001C90CC4E|nr:hypothetical protein [Rhizobium laguerreae]MBY3211503.1 hypothetical protein [Rhizobium laguerreae]
MSAYVQTEVNKIGLPQETKDKQWGRAEEYVAKQGLEPDSQGCSITATMLRNQLPDVITTPMPATPTKSPF